MSLDFKDLGYKNRFECARDQFKQFKQEKQYFEHYLANAVYALCNGSKLFVDYRHLGHKNLLMDHGFDRLLMFTERSFDEIEEDKGIIKSLEKEVH